MVRAAATPSASLKGGRPLFRRCCGPRGGEGPGTIGIFEEREEGVRSGSRGRGRFSGAAYSETDPLTLDDPDETTFRLSPVAAYEVYDTSRSSIAELSATVAADQAVVYIEMIVLFDW